MQHGNNVATLITTAPSKASKANPLCVNLDGTLLLSNSLFEAALSLIRSSPANLLRLLLWWLRGVTFFKQQVASHAAINVQLLPYNEPLLAYLREQCQLRDIYLLSGSHHYLADAIAEHLGFFSGVYASDATNNLVGVHKRDKLVHLFGPQGFSYIGSSRRDWPVWEAADKVGLVAAPGRFRRRTLNRFDVSQEFIRPRLSFRRLTRAARVHQWTKNLLLFIPLLLDHRILDWQAMLTVATCFACLSLFASSTYLLNDLLDLDADRQNSTKRHRALAAGKLSPGQALVTAGGLLAASVLLLPFVPWVFTQVLGVYAVITLAYTLVLKKIMMVDVCVLAALFTLRIIGGGLAVGANLSFWLLAFSMFFFLSLVMGKRVSELVNANKEQKNVIQGRGYLPEDQQLLNSAGTSAGFMSVLVVALFINSEEVTQVYAVPEILWLICPLLLYWVSRFWLIVSRGEMHEDPIIFALRDSISLGIVVVGAAIIALGSYYSQIPL